MIYETDSFCAIEALLRKHASLMMRVGDPLRPESQRKIIGAWRAPIDRKTISRMKRMRARGVTIGDIARTHRVSWRTAWRLSKNE